VVACIGFSAQTTDKMAVSAKPLEKVKLAVTVV